MKRVLLSLLFTAVFSGAYAQLTWSIKASGGYAMFTGDCSFGELQGKAVGKIGLGAEVPLNRNLSLMPYLELAMKGANWSFSDEYGSQEEKYNLMYVQLPILLAYRVNLTSHWNMIFKFGPYVGLGIKGAIKLEHKCVDEQYSREGDLFNDVGTSRFDYGANIGVDFENHNFMIGVELEKGLGSISDYDVGFKNQVIYASIGLKF